MPSFHKFRKKIARSRLKNDMIQIRAQMCKDFDQQIALFTKRWLDQFGTQPTTEKCSDLSYKEPVLGSLNLPDVKFHLFGDDGIAGLSQ